MTPADQSVLSDPERGVVGDCWRTCIAIVLDLDPRDVPHFVAGECSDGDTERWYLDTMRWLNERRLDGIFIYDPSYGSGKQLRTGQYVVLGGDSPRGPWGHCVVARVPVGGVQHLDDFEIVWDPHPSRAGLATRTDAFLIEKLEEAV